MNTKKTFSILLLLAGEALLIICFLYFGRNLEAKLLTLNIIVSSIIYSLFFIDILFPMVDRKDESHKTIGSLGIRWFTTLLYVLFAIGAMVNFNVVKPIDINSQILIHGILFFLLCLGLYFAFSASVKVHEVFIEEKQMRSHLEEMKKMTKDVQNKFALMKDIPADTLKRITALQEDLRYLTPSNNRDAIELETNFLNEMKAVRNCLFEMPTNYNKIIENIQNCERIYKERKQTYSN